MFQTIFSILLILLASFLYKKSRASVASVLLFVIFTLISVVLYLLYGIANYFTGSGISDAVVFHLRYGLGGAGFGDYSNLIFTAGGFVIVCVILLALLCRSVLAKEERKPAYQYLAFVGLVASIILNPATSDIYVTFHSVYAATHLETAQTVSGANTNDKVPTFADIYKEPQIEKTGKTKNLIIIYGESLEQTYSDETLFPGLTKNLNELQKQSTYFSNVRQLVGTGYTIAGMVSSQCGIPLFSLSHGNSMSGMDKFLPGARCLGELLRGQGYYLAYTGGANLGFAGKGNFYTTHGFHEVLGLKEILPQTPDPSYRNGWGLYDDSLFDFSYKKFEELSKTKDKFALVTLTLDTHHPKGNMSKSCTPYQDGSNEILNAVTCSDQLIHKFVQKIWASPYADNTVIVIVSDHLAMPNTASEQLETRDRKNRFMILEQGKTTPTEIASLGSTLDTGATILPFIGYSGEIGLGRNLMASSTTEMNTEFIHSHLWLWQQHIIDFWNFPKITKHLSINLETKTVEIDNRTFSFPTFIEISPELNATLKFHFNLTVEEPNLAANADTVMPGSLFMLIDKCADAKLLDSRLPDTGFCLVIGKENERVAMALTANHHMSADQIKDWFLELPGAKHKINFVANTETP